MTIERPYNAIDNEINKKMQEIFIRYAKKHNYEIKTIKIYSKALLVETTTGKQFALNISDCSRMTNRNISDYFYMKIIINGKQKRIPKSEW